MRETHVGSFRNGEVAYFALGMGALMALSEVCLFSIFLERVSKY